MNMNFITEMEEAEESLKKKYNQFGMSAHHKTLIEALFKFLKDRQCVSSAALQVQDAFMALVEEKEELNERDKAIFQALTTRMNSDLMHQRFALMEYYNQLMRACKEFQNLFNKVVKYKNKVITELETLNKKLENFNDKLETIGNGGDEPFKVPKFQMKRVTKCTDAAFEQIDVLNKFIRRLRGNLDVAEDVLRNPQKLKHLEESAGATHSSSSSPEISSNDDSDSGEEVLTDMGCN